MENGFSMNARTVSSLLLFTVSCIKKRATTLLVFILSTVTLPEIFNAYELESKR